VGVEEVDEGLCACALCALERGPLGEEIEEDGGLLVAKPRKNLRKVGLEREGKAVGEADAILNEIPAGFDEAAQGAHVDGVAAQRLELVAVAKEDVESYLGIGGVILGATGNEGPTVLGECGWIDGEDDEEVVLEESRDDGPLGKLDADGDRLAVEAAAQICGPGGDGLGTVFEDGSLETINTRNTEANVVFLVCPVDADEGCKFGLVHGIPLGRFDLGHAEPSPAKAIWRAEIQTEGAAFGHPVAAGRELLRRLELTERAW
jgi:hypothetical protein